VIFALTSALGAGLTGAVTYVKTKKKYLKDAYGY